jgi:hypothetical protein
MRMACSDENGLAKKTDFFFGGIFPYMPQAEGRM